MTYPVYNFFNRAKGTIYISNKIEEKKKISEKFVIVGEELYGIDTDDIGNLEDLVRLIFIDRECGNPKEVDLWWRAY